MTLHIYDCEQRSDEWYELRRGIVTASVVGQLLTPTLKVASNETSRGVIAGLVAERISGVIEQSFTNDDMMRGILHEPVAREAYAENYAPVTEVGFMVKAEGDWTLGCSPDGLVGDDGLIEIKCPRQRGHVQTILADSVPYHYVAQCQAALLVSGRDWLDYVSFHAGLPLFVKRVHPDAEWFAAITEACKAFEIAATQMTHDYLAAADGLVATERIPEEITF